VNKYSLIYTNGFCRNPNGFPNGFCNGLLTQQSNGFPNGFCNGLLTQQSNGFPNGFCTADSAVTSLLTSSNGFYYHLFQTVFVKKVILLTP
jgi:hypothetical protein